jgi:hypothetical protein
VVDVDVVDPKTNDSITLDGTLGFNFLSTSMTADLSGTTYTPFDWVVFDEPGGVLGLQIPVTVAGRHVFYNHSGFDGNDVLANAADDHAIATDKIALLPNRRGTFSNYTSYDKGVNGVMIDIDGLPAGLTLTADDFDFRSGNTANVASWTAGPTPAGVTVRRGAGDNGSDRVTLTWSDYGRPGAAPDHQAVANGWLQVKVKANGNTGLTVPDVFYVGNLVGDTGNGTTAVVKLLDAVGIRRNFSSKPVAVDNKWDVNRDGKVGALDILAARRAQTPPHALPLITGASAGAPAAPAGAAPSGRSVFAAAGPTAMLSPVRMTRTLLTPGDEESRSLLA